MPANIIDNDRLAVEIAPAKLLTPTGRRLLRAEMSASEYLDALIDHGLTADAIRFLAAWLPPREAIWWGCVCLQFSAEIDTQVVEELAALGAMAQWVVNPEKPCKIGPESIPSKPAARLAHAVQACNPKAPTPTLVPGYVSAALLGAAARAPSQAMQRQRRILALGIHIGRGKYLWNEPPKAPKD